MTAWWCLGVPLQILTPLLEGVTPLWTLLRRSRGEWRIIIQGYVNVRKIMQSHYGNRIQLHCASFHCIFIVDTTHQTTAPLNVLSLIISWFLHTENDQKWPLKIFIKAARCKVSTLCWADVSRHVEAAWAGHRCWCRAEAAERREVPWFYVNKYSLRTSGAVFTCEGETMY